MPQYIMHEVCRLQSTLCTRCVQSYNHDHCHGFIAGSFPLPWCHHDSKPITAVKPQSSSPFPQDLPWEIAPSHSLAANTSYSLLTLLLAYGTVLLLHEC